MRGPGPQRNRTAGPAFSIGKPSFPAREFRDLKEGRMVETAMYDGSKPPSEIEEDIARTRVRLSAAINALERELVPARVIEASTEMLRSSLEPAPGPFRQQAWAYAIPLALIATGLGW